MDARLYLEDLKTKFNKIQSCKYFLSYSGGKDSHFLYWFIKEYAEIEDIPIISVNTRMEHEEIRARMYAHADKVLLPELTPLQVKQRYGSPCFSKNQDYFIDKWQRGQRPPSIVDRVMGTKKSFFNLSKKARELLLTGKLHRISPRCCEILKKQPLKRYQKETGRMPILGVRAAEGVNRAGIYKSCFTKTGKFTPIFDLTDELLDEIYSIYKIPVPNIYQHIGRTGCMGCPYGIYKKDCQRQLKLMSKRKLDYCYKLFGESYEIRGINLDCCSLFEDKDED